MAFITIFREAAESFAEAHVLSLYSSVSGLIGSIRYRARPCASPGLYASELAPVLSETQA